MCDIFIIMDRQQILGRQKGSYEDGIDQFEEFKEQYTTYQLEPENSPTTLSLKPPKKQTFKLQSEKPKLKIIQEVPENTLQTEFLKTNRKIRKAITNSSRVINVGGATFKGNFQSGNIYSVAKIGQNTYQITLNKETSSNRVSAWFYFACEGLRGENRFVIKGFTKTSSLFNQGMRICYRQASENDVWRRGGTKICYTESAQEQNEKTTYELRFTFFFKQSPLNSVEFAYCFPYTYTNLINFLSLSKPHLYLQSLGKSYQGREIPLVTFGNLNSKYVVVISARAHPGQTVGSWMMEGFLKELISQSDHSKNLRQAFLFKIIPMINVDGVVEGNYRFSGSGFDLNRKWKACKEKYHPQVYKLKKFIKNLNSEKEVLMYIDLHGHSRQKNVFFYGCCPKGSVDSEGNPNKKPKQFPYLMSKLLSHFRYDYCSFAVQKSKQGTARIAMWNQLKINYVYTLEASFCGNQGGQNYLISDYEKVGAKLCIGIGLYFCELIQELLKEINPEGAHSLVARKMVEELKKNMNQFYENPSLGQMDFLGNSSDSEPEAGQISEEIRQNPHYQHFEEVTSQKAEKSSKILKLNEKSFTYDQKALRDKFKKSQVEEKPKKPTQTATYSISLSQRKDKELKPPVNKTENRRQIKTSTAKSTNNSFSIRAEILSKTINQKLNHFEKKKYEISENISTRFIGIKDYKDKFESIQSAEIFPTQRKQILNSKKKAVSFEGAQYRRVRKLAEEHNRRHFSVQQTADIHEDNELIKGLIGMNNLLQIDPIKATAKQGSIFPNASTKNRRQSIEIHFKKHIKGVDLSSRRLQINGLQPEVKCFGRQIL